MIIQMTKLNLEEPFKIWMFSFLEESNEFIRMTGSLAMKRDI